MNQKHSSRKEKVITLTIMHFHLISIAFEVKSLNRYQIKKMHLKLLLFSC